MAGRAVPGWECPSWGSHPRVRLRVWGRVGRSALLHPLLLPLFKRVLLSHAICTYVARHIESQTRLASADQCAQRVRERRETPDSTVNQTKHMVAQLSTKSKKSCTTNKANGSHAKASCTATRSTAGKRELTSCPRLRRAHHLPPRKALPRLSPLELFARRRLDDDIAPRGEVRHTGGAAAGGGDPEVGGARPRARLPGRACVSPASQRRGVAREARRSWHRGVLREDQRRAAAAAAGRDTAGCAATAGGAELQ